MTEPFLSEIRIFSFGFAPRGWALCDGQLLSISQNAALFSLVGTTYGGDGETTFALPNLQGSVPMHPGPGFVLGQRSGELTHTLILGELPSHSHQPAGGSTATSPGPSDNVWGTNTQNTYTSATPDTGMNPSSVSATGGQQPHQNQPPYLTLNFCIAITGLFPSRN